MLIKLPVRSSPGPPTFSSLMLFPGLKDEAAVVSLLPGPYGFIAASVVAASVVREGDSVPLGTVGFKLSVESPGWAALVVSPGWA